MKEIYLIVERMEIVSGDKTFVTSKIFPCATNEIAIRVAQENADKKREDMLKLFGEENYIESGGLINFDKDFTYFGKHSKSNSFLEISTETQNIINE